MSELTDGLRSNVAYRQSRYLAWRADEFNLSTMRNNYRKLYRERQYPILRLRESQRGVRILSKRKRGMLLGARSVLIVPLQYKIQSDISSRRRYREESVPRGMLCAGGMRTPVPVRQTVFNSTCPVKSHSRNVLKA